MIWDEKKSTYTLTSGRRFYANCGILGLGVHGTEVFEGYDAPVSIDNTVEWTQEEREEIMLTMLRRWAAWGGWECWNA